MQSVLDLTPIAYFPMDDFAYATAARDVSGNNHQCLYASQQTDQSGNHGASVYFNPGDANYGMFMSSGLLTAIDPREFSVSCWVKADTTGVTNKVYEGWNAAGDYYAFEIRPNGTNGIFLKEGGVNQTINSGLGTTPSNTWTHLVCYNSESTGKCGVYMNGTKYEADRTLGGITPPIIATGSGAYAFTAGYGQHLAFFDHALSQAEVNTICT